MEQTQVLTADNELHTRMLGMDDQRVPCIIGSLGVGFTATDTKHAITIKKGIERHKGAG